MSLFVEKPRNKDGYRFYTPAVIKGHIEGDRIVVTAPSKFTELHSSIDTDEFSVDTNGFQEVSEEAGPPRIPDASEHGNDLAAWRDSIISKYAVYGRPVF